ncbi:MAG: hypothetical protein IIX30_03685 [Clostridia bacterium]|jgi:hypothetical protein|nr:hypothetical protein [Clostridia bacterium]
MKRSNNKISVKQLTICAMLVALGVIFLGIGSLLEVLDISMAVIASLCVIIAVIEYGKGAPWMVYAAISLLSLLLIPNRLPAIFFALFFGFYPIIKEKLERKSKVVCWLLKELIFNVCLAIIVALYFLLFFQGFSLNIPLHWLIVIVVLLCELVFILYDIALTRMISFYVINIRKRFKFKFK